MSTGWRIFLRAAVWRTGHRNLTASWRTRQLDLILDRLVLEIVDQDLEPQPPDACDRNAEIVDPPGRASRAGRTLAQRLDAGRRMGEDERQVLDRERVLLVIEHLHINRGAVRTLRLDLDLGHGAVAMEMDRDVLAGRQGPRRRREAPQHHQRKSTKRDGAWTTARRHCRRNCEKSHRHGNLSCSNLS